MTTAHAVSDFGGASGRPAGDLIARLGAKVRRLLNPDWALFRSGKTTDELIVAHHGPLEIRRTLAGWSLETCVRGEPDRARATALRRLSNYVDGKNRSSTRLCAARPLVQTEVSMCRWRISVALPGVDSDFVAASRRNGRVRLRALDSETVAVIRVPGRPTKLAIQHAETAIRHAIAPTGWEATGGAMLRLHALPVVLPFLSRFEVAVPVVERRYGSVMPDSMRSVVFSGATAHEGMTQSSPPVR
jgi:SOUL heme-binding protein